MPNDIGELRQYAAIHARSLAIPRYQQLLAGIRTDDDGAGSWTREWCRAGEQLERQGKYLQASSHFAVARFPYTDGPARQEAQERCVGAFDQWRAGRPVERLDLAVPGGRVRCWASGLSATDRRPILLVMGGIVTVKEQHAAMLANIGRLGMAGVVTEMPGVGENTLAYTADSGQMIGSLLDVLADRADASRTYALALSFSGHMALRCAAADPRIKGIVTAGAPVSGFFTSATWLHNVPRITLDTLAYLTGIDANKLPDQLGDWALTNLELAALNIPVAYMVSLRDEIVPPDEVRRLQEHVHELAVLEQDDEHGSPRHVAETKLWAISSLLRMRGVRNSSSVVAGTLAQAVRLWGKASGARSR
jgi:esterase FrsA